MKLGDTVWVAVDENDELLMSCNYSTLMEPTKESAIEEVDGATHIYNRQGVQHVRIVPVQILQTSRPEEKP